MADERVLEFSAWETIGAAIPHAMPVTRITREDNPAFFAALDRAIEEGWCRVTEDGTCEFLKDGKWAPLGDNDAESVPAGS